jgi:hypothetical protein
MQQHNLQTKKKMKKRDFFLFFILLQNNATRKNFDKNKTKRTKKKLWLKAQIAKESEHKKREKAIKTAPILTLA